MSSGNTKPRRVVAMAPRKKSTRNMWDRSGYTRFRTRFIANATPPETTRYSMAGSFPIMPALFGFMPGYFIPYRFGKHQKHDHRHVTGRIGGPARAVSGDATETRTAGAGRGPARTAQRLPGSRASARRAA